MATFRVLGVDPGSRVTGWGVVERDGNRLIYVASGAITATKRGDAFADRLEVIFDGVSAALQEHQPDVVSLEGIFHHKNAKSALKLGQARGVILLAATKAQVDVVEYAPAKVKQSVVGYGGADKDQVAKMVALLLGIPIPRPADISDALANAICHCNASQLLERLR